MMQPDDMDYLCPFCWVRSYHRRDATERYCARCHRFEDDGEAPPVPKR
jgi:hypothetical protein